MVKALKLILDKIARQLLEPLKPPLVILLGVFTTVWGVWVGVPFWSVFQEAVLYSEMERLMPEVVWGLLAFIIGLVMVYGVMKRKYRTLLISATVSGWFWSMVAILYLLGDWRSTGFLTAATFSIYSGFIYLNLKVNKNRLGLDVEHSDILIGGPK